MTDQEFRELDRGDIVRHRMDRARSYIVDGNYGGHVTAVRTVDISNPSEWEVVYKADYSRPIGERDDKPRS